MNGDGRFAGRAALAVLPLLALLALSGCSTAAALRGEGEAPPGAPEAPPSPMMGRPLYSLTVGGAAPAAPPSAAAPPFTVPPFSPADEIAGRWLLLFELSYPAFPSGTAGP